MTTIEEIYKFDEDEIADRIKEDGDYWDSVYKFYESVRDKDVGLVTEKQIAWLDKIGEALEE